MNALATPPAPLRPRERRLAWFLSVAVALTRWPALSKTLWDWDEALFALAVTDYDVTLHHPHPPGFPLFIALAKLLPLEPFRALQSVTFVASLFAFPAMFFLARELRARTFVAFASALLLAFFPNVWFYGGTALSDVPSMVLVLTASALLLRGCRDERALLAGCIVLGIAAGMRPQNLVIGFAPFAIAFFHRRRTALAGGALIAAILAVSYGAAAAASGGWDEYREAVTAHERYIRVTDSFVAPLRPWLPQVFDDFFLRPYRAPLINIVVSILAFLGLLRGRAWIAVATFGPFLLFAWLFLDFHSSSRFSIAYMPLFALLAAEGLPAKGRVPLLGVLVALMIGWTWPALRVVHTTASPPVAALEDLRKLDRRFPVYVDERLAAHADLLLGRDFRVVRVTGHFAANAPGVLLKEGASVARGARSYTRERGRLAGIARPRYFEVSLVYVR